MRGSIWLENILQIDKEGKSRLLFTKDVKNTLREFRLYKWDNKSKKDVVKKDNDHQWTV